MSTLAVAGVVWACWGFVALAVVVTGQAIVTHFKHTRAQRQRERRLRALIERSERRSSEARATIDRAQRFHREVMELEQIAALPTFDPHTGGR